MSERETYTRRGRPTTRRTNLFSRDLKSMMYAFGDEDSRPDSIAVMDDILTDFIMELCLQAGQVAGPRQKVKVDDFKFVLRNDPKKLGRVEELLSLQKEIQQSRKLFDEAAEK